MEESATTRSRRGPRLGLATLGGVAALGLGLALARAAMKQATLDCGPFSLAVVQRVNTGLQRAERLAFIDGGRRLAVLCPRYQKVVLYDVVATDGRPRLDLAAQVALGGRPVALAAADDRLYVLQRPANDARHIEEGFWEAYDFAGRPLGPKFRVGWDPDDLVLTPDGRTALVLTSGHAEDEPGKPDPALVVVDIADRARPRLRSRLAFTQPGDDPHRIALELDAGRRAAVSLRGTNTIARLDLSDLDQPHLAGRDALPTPHSPGPLHFRADGGLRVADADGVTLWDLAAEPGSPARAVGADAGEALRFRSAPRGVEWELILNPKASALEVRGPEGWSGQLALRNGSGLGGVVPLGVALAPGGEHMAVADKAGGVHLIAMGPKSEL